MLKTILLVGTGGFLGSICRYLVTVLTERYMTFVPLATFVVNITGCILLGILMGFSLRSGTYNPHLKMLWMTGFCGGFTTFSAFTLDNINLLNSGKPGQFVLYALGSLVTGMLAMIAGYKISSF